MMLILRSHVSVSQLKDAQGAEVLPQTFFEQHDEADFDIIMNLDNSIQIYTSQNMKQKQITEYFD